MVVAKRWRVAPRSERALASPVAQPQDPRRPNNIMDTIVIGLAPSVDVPRAHVTHKPLGYLGVFMAQRHQIGLRDVVLWARHKFFVFYIAKKRKENVSACKLILFVKAKKW